MSVSTPGPAGERGGVPAMITNEYKLNGDDMDTFLVKVKGSRRKGRKSFFVSRGDTSVARQHTWTLNRGDYVVCTKCGMLLHRVLLNPGPDQLVDHINGDPADNRRSNIRIAHHRENMWNSRRHNRFGLPVAGVFPVGSKWRAVIVSNGVRIVLGTFDDLYDAVLCRVRAEYERRGEYSTSHRPWLPSVPKQYLDHWLPEIYSKNNRKFVNGHIWRAHFKGEYRKEDRVKLNKKLNGLTFAGTERGGLKSSTAARSFTEEKGTT
ncbi:HNH endonuclease [Dietzia maris]|uniref:HNH endonuclease n=1 Tax=Dietzia maris TaxID=37915 RepID=UPI0037C9B2B6